ncbi:copper chaperone PCu(A)C [Hydrogenophaga flava]|uniref:copper chaperone PCu(A)C n=1 Tax=Hydrogenophaga flava TaxID=65657 RepID=UPI00082587FD|nr:copper chaperone PCu(A)C [Hydrogenophaga flava]
MKHLISIALVAASASAFAQSSVEIKDPWVRATVAQQKATGAFMQLTAKADSKLVEAKSPVAGVVEIHEMAMDNNVMKMRQIPGLALPAGKAVELKPGGYHVMLLDLKAQVKEGDVVPVTLVFEGKDGKRETVEVKAPAKPLATPAAMGSKPAPAAEHKH